jgi:thioredoxin reductase (NADPH)
MQTADGATPRTDVRPPDPKPIIFAVDDDLGVLGAVARDLRREYGQQYRIMRASAGADALVDLEKLRLANHPVALFLVDQRMPDMSGLEFLAAARELYPNAKRALLTAYADSQASIQAINETRLDYYLMKPWDPPEERLYPIVTELLDDWHAENRPAYSGLTLIGHPYSAITHDLKDFLGRNLVPYRWLDVETEPEAEELLRLSGNGAGDLPVLLLTDGTVLVKPTKTQIAQSIGLQTKAGMHLYDLVIVGAGPAGLAAAVYASSEGLSTVLVESHAPGGQAGQSSRIENYLGFPAGLSGADLSRRATTQARRFGAEILTPTVAVGLRREDPFRFVKLADGTEIGGKAVLVATGVSYRKLDTPGAERLAGVGVYYGAAQTEAVSVKGAHAFVIGGGNSAGQAAMYLSQFAERVTMLIRGSGLAATMSQYLVAQIEQTPAIDVRTRAVVEGMIGSEKLEAVTVRDIDTNESQTFPAAGVFVFIGAAPHTSWLTDAVTADPQGYLFTGVDLSKASGLPVGWNVDREPYWLETSVPGVFAAGDVRHRSVKRIASAVGEGAMALQFVHQHLASL